MSGNKFHFKKIILHNLEYQIYNNSLELKKYPPIPKNRKKENKILCENILLFAKEQYGIQKKYDSNEDLTNLDYIPSLLQNEEWNFPPHFSIFDENKEKYEFKNH